jgi:hypothetical protein
MVLRNKALLQNSVAESRDCLSHYKAFMSDFNVTQLHGTWFYSKHAWGVLRLRMEVVTLRYGAQLGLH